MRATKYPLAVLASVVLIAGLLCAQICDINCTLYGCALSSPVKAADESSEHSHCHEHKENPRPQERGHSRECPGHFDSTTLPSPFVVSAYSLHHAVHIGHPAIGPSLAFNRLPVGLKIQTDRLPDRSPPAHSVLRI
jgi:hypothetical protein